VEDLLESDSLTDYYRDFLKRQEGKSRFKESLVTGSARINHFQVVMAISEFYYCGGSMGVVFGEKFRRAMIMPYRRPPFYKCMLFRRSKAL
jgi:acetyl-CoA carboxylase beta subunit